MTHIILLTCLMLKGSPQGVFVQRTFWWSIYVSTVLFLFKFVNFCALISWLILYLSLVTFFVIQSSPKFNGDGEFWHIELVDQQHWHKYEFLCPQTCIQKLEKRILASGMFPHFHVSSKSSSLSIHGPWDSHWLMSMITSWWCHGRCTPADIITEDLEGN